MIKDILIGVKNLYLVKISNNSIPLHLSMISEISLVILKLVCPTQNLKILLEELEDQNTQDRNEYIIRQDGLRTRSKLHVLIKYVYSKVI